LLSSQFNEPVPAWHVPPAQMSPVVQALLSEHVDVLLTLAGHPVDGSHTPSSVHGLLSSQITRLDPTHTPPEHVSVCVQRFPSLQVEPLALFGFEQTPVPVLQVPTSWHWSLAVQTTGFDPVQIPDWHVSVWVQALPSVHAVPLAAFGFEHVPLAGLHVPATWH
jgi:hypothetical protein